MFHENDIDRLRKATAYDSNGERIGNVGEVYLDDQTGKPMWVTVNTGFFGMNTSFVPLAGATFQEEDHLVVAHRKDVVKDAPNISEDGHLDRTQEDELYRYYGVSGDEVAADAMRTRRWTDESDYAPQRRDDGPLFDRAEDPHSNRGYAGDTGDLGGERVHEGSGYGDRTHEGSGYGDRTHDDRTDGPMFDRDRDGRGPVEEVLDGRDDPRHPRQS